MDDRFDIGRDHDGSVGSHQRSDGRDSTFLHAELARAGGAAMKVRVRNLSKGGLMAETDQYFVPGDAVTVELRSVGQVTARIAWVHGGRVGIAFDHPIDPSLARKAPPQSAVAAMMVRPVVGPAKRPKLRDQ